MDDIAQGASEAQGSGLPVDNSSAVNTAAPERKFSQAEVNELIKREKYHAVEDYRRLQTQQPSYHEQKYGSTATQTAATQGSSQFIPNESDYRRLAAEEAQRLRDTWVSEAQQKAQAEQAQQIVQNFWNKLAPGKQDYEDFEKITGDIEYANFPNTVQLLASHIDNAHDVLYELGKDRLKMAQLEQLAGMSPKDAIIQAKRLAESIRDNKQAAKIKSPNEPLSQLRPSNQGMETGVLSVSDYRKRYKI